MLGPRAVRRSLRASAPSFLQTLNSRDENGIKILECHVDGYPRPDIRWEKDGKTVGKSRRIHMVRSGDMCLLQIRMLQEEDFGLYTCIASNIVGTTSTHIRLGTTIQQRSRNLSGSSPETLKPIKRTGLRSRSMERSRDFIKENKNLCSQRSRSRSTSRNSKQDNSNSSKTKLSSFTNSILKRSDAHNYQKFETSSKKHDLSKSMEDCRKVRKSFLDKMKIPDIFVHKDDSHLTNGNVKKTDTVLPIINVTVDSENYSDEMKINGDSPPRLLKKRFFKSESLKDKSPKAPLKNGSMKNASQKNIPIKNGFPRSESLKNEILKNKELRDFPEKEPENLGQTKSRSKFAAYLKIFDSASSANKLKKPQNERGCSLKINKHEKNEKTGCDNSETEGFFARFMRRKSFGGERKSSEPPEISNFVSHISHEFLNNIDNVGDTHLENNDIDSRDSSNKTSSSRLNDENLEKIDNRDVLENSQTFQVHPDVPNVCSIVDTYVESDIVITESAKSTSNENTQVLDAKTESAKSTSNENTEVLDAKTESAKSTSNEITQVLDVKTESAKNASNENTEVLDVKDNCLSDSTNSHSTEESTAIELTPLAENAKNFNSQDVPNEETQDIPSINVEEIPIKDISVLSKDVDEDIIIKEDKPNDTCPTENNASSTDHHFEGIISYSKPLNDEKCEDLLEATSQKESFDSGLQRVSSPIESPARIITGPQSVTVLRGESVTLAISFSGEPVPNVIWMKGGRVLRCSEDGRLSILEGREMSVVTVNEVTADDSGKYVVCVENEGGGDSRFASVAVVGFPEPPGGEPTASEFTDHSLVLSWYGSMYDGGSVVTGYQVEMCTLPDKKWHKVTSSVNTSCSVQGLSMGQKYIFRVRAENRYGVSHPSKESKIICLNDYLQYDTSSDEEPEDVPESAVTIENGTHFTERFDLKEEVGKGRFGTVYRCVELSCGRARAAKIIRCLKMKDKEKVRQEIEIMSRLHHPKLMQVLAAFESGKNMIMVMEFISGGELFERVIADDFVLTEQDCILFMRQICDGVAYMHKNNILHLDLKPENILCKTRTSHKIKIIDFGLAREYNSSDNLRILFGTPEFVAPEVLNYEPVSPASDMWSVGVICYVLLSGLSPFMGDNDNETFANITRAEMDFEDDAFDEISQDAKDFISGLLVKKIKGRMSAEECLKHPWLATPRLVQKRPLSTEKLKRFIIRRKWQKSGTAIRALGRMVSLSRSSLGSSCDSYSPIGSPTSSRSRTSLASRSETADSGDSEVFSR